MVTPEKGVCAGVEAPSKRRSGDAAASRLIGVGAGANNGEAAIVPSQRVRS